MGSAREQIAAGAHGRPCGDPAVPQTEQVEHLLGATLRMGTPRSAEELLDGIGNAMRAVMRSPAAVGERRKTAFLNPLPPLVPRLAATPIALSELGHGAQPATEISDELVTRFKRGDLQPR